MELKRLFSFLLKDVFYPFIVPGLRIVFISKMQIFRETSEPVEESECDFI